VSDLQFNRSPLDCNEIAGSQIPVKTLTPTSAKAGAVVVSRPSLGSTAETGGVHLVINPMESTPCSDSYVLDRHRSCNRASESIMRRNNELDAAQALLRAAGVHDVTVANGGRHVQLRWIGRNGRFRMVTVSRTSGDWRSPHNLRAEIRRQLRFDGMLPEPPAPKPPPCWRTQIRSVVRQLDRISVPVEKAPCLGQVKRDLLAQL
jgi:hypothetical protein